MFLDVLMFNIRTFTDFIVIIYSMVTHGMVLIETKMGPMYGNTKCIITTKNIHKVFIIAFISIVLNRESVNAYM